MHLKPFKEIVALTKEKVTEVMAIPRARRLKAQAETELADLDMEIITLEGKIEESLYNEEAFKNFSFKSLMEQLDKLALLERRKKMYAKILDQLFPDRE